MSGPEPEKSAGLLPTIGICVLILGSAAGLITWIYSSEPTATREGATRKTPALVETVVAQRGEHRPRLTVLGVVRPARDIVLSPQVAGPITSRDPSFVPGGIVEAGAELLTIDRVDFESLLLTRKSELKQAEASLALEEGQQSLARREFEAIGEDLDDANRALVLREPQIASVRARIDAAKAAVERAELDLERTKIVAPFDAQVLSTAVDLGSRVAPGDRLGRLVGVDEYWVVASVRLRDLQWLQFRDRAGTGSSAAIRHTAAWPSGVTREGAVARLIGAVDEETRLARVVVSVTDPLGRSSGAPPLIVGTVVEVQIDGTPLEDVVQVDRDHLRQRETLWVMADNKLEIRNVDVLFRDSDSAYLRSGVENGEHIVATNLASVREGLPLRRADGTTAAEPRTASTNGAHP